MIFATNPMGMRRVFVMGAVAAMVAQAMVARVPARATAGYLHLTGGLHTHTGYSDGRPGAGPGDAYDSAKAKGLDFFAVTEHSESLDVPMTLSEDCLPTEGGGLVECALADEPIEALGKWDAQRRQAANASVPGSFTALRGFEWSSDVHGHINVYFSRNYTQWVRDGGNATLEGFYRWLTSPAFLGGGDDGLATFNHPGDKTICEQAEPPPPADAICPNDPFANWRNFAYREELDDRIVGIEIYNRGRDYEPYVIQALDLGWHLGLIGAEDVHDDSWGRSQWAKTVLLATDRTPAALKEAFAARRMYATRDSDLRLTFESDGRPMGSRVSFDGPGFASLHARADGGSVGSIEILSNGGDVVASATGREVGMAVLPGPERWYLARVTDPAGRRVAYSSPIWVRSGEEPAAFQPQWVAGDLHVHTTWSHDSYGGPTDDNTHPDEDPEDLITAGWTPGEQISIAESRDLDYVAITDHNDTRSVYDPGFTSGRLTVVPAYENSLAGHVQMIGATSCVVPEGPVPRNTGCNSFPNRDERARIRALADQIRSLGGLFQINHPSDGDWLSTFGDGSHPDPIVPDSVEVWNIGPWHWQPPMPSANDNDFSLRFWETYLNAGYHVAATGGSDNHWRSTTAAQGVGQPTTWVFVTKPGVEGIVDGIRAGRTTISHQPPSFLGIGPELYLMADTDGDGEFEAMVGDTVPPGSTIRLNAWNLYVPPGGSYWIVTNDSSFEIPLDRATTIPAGTRWLRAELRHPDAQPERTAACDPLVGSETTYCRNRLILEAVTSPIYVS